MGYHKTSALEEIHSYQLNQKDRVIYVNSESADESGESGVDYNMSQRFIKNLDYLNSLNQNPITVKMHNIGGDWNHGMSMYDAMYFSVAPVTVIMYAYAASMGSIIPQAATTRIIMPNCDFMVHYGTTGGSGDAREVESMIDHYKATKDRMIQIYAKRCVESECEFVKEKKMTEARMFNYIQKKIEKNNAWWMTAKEAVYYGFMDKIYGEDE